MTIQDLKNQGFRVYLSHFRYYEVQDEMVDDLGVICEFKYKYPLMTKGQAADQFSLDGDYILPRGGESRISVLKGEELVASAKAVCSSNDIFNKRRAISILLGRISKKLSVKTM